MKKLLVVTSLLHMMAICLCAPSKEVQKNSNTTYDQRQVGKYNIHLNIKDVSIIALSSEDLIDHIGDSDSYDDYYDYAESEYTVDPVTADLSGKPTTKKPNITQSNDSILPSIAGLNLSSISTSTDPTLSSSTIPQALVFIHEKPSSSPDVDKNVESSSVSYRPDEIPVQVIVEPLLKPKVRQSSPQTMKRKLSNRQVNEKFDDDDYEVRPRRRRGQIVERIRARRAQNRLSRNSNGSGCGKGDDGQDGCRVRRSGMSGFLEMLTKLLPRGE